MEKTHVFELAGLGKAPFQFVGSYESRLPNTNQPAGTCEYCGNGIATCCRIRSSDSKEFVVGSDCVLKTGDIGLKAQIDEMKRKANIQKQLQQIEVNKSWIEENRDALSNIAHPNGRGSWLDVIQWYYKNAGRAGKINIIKAAQKSIAA